MRLVFLCCSLLLVLDAGTLAHADPELQFKKRTVGEWTAFENAVRDRDSILDKVGNDTPMATTKALDGRKGELGIFVCSRFSVLLSLVPDQQFDGESEPQIGDIYRYAFTKILSDKKSLIEDDIDVPDGPEKILLQRQPDGGLEKFHDAVDVMVSSSRYRVCPTREEGPRCMSFSLKGFTSALNMVCPKR